MTTMNDARRAKQRMDRINATAKMNKCGCGNIAGLNHSKCGRCRDRDAAAEAERQLTSVDAVALAGHLRDYLVEAWDGVGIPQVSDIADRIMEWRR